MHEAKKIWLVKGNGPANVMHDNRPAAEAEARRLACIHPGQNFWVMESVAVHRNVSTTRISLDGLDEDGSLQF